MKTRKFMFNVCLGLSAVFMFSQCVEDTVTDDGNGDGNGNSVEEVEIASEGTPWVILDMESESTKFKLTAKNTDKLEYVANPDNSGINTSSKSLKWMKAKSGNLYVDVLDIETYYDLSKWKSIKFDVRTSGATITQCKAVLYKSDMDEENRIDKQLASYEITDANIEANTWGALFISLDKLTFASGVTKDDLKKVNYIKLMINSTEDSEVELYIDNIEFTNETTLSDDNDNEGDGTEEPDGDYIQDPGGLEWTLLDMDTDEGMPVLTDDDSGTFKLLTYDDCILSVENENDNNILKWTFGGIGFPSLTLKPFIESKVIDLSKWNSFNFKFRSTVEDTGFIKIQIWKKINTEDGINSVTIANFESWSTFAKNIWHDFQIPFSSLIYVQGYDSNDLLNVSSIVIHINSYKKNDVIYIDNISLKRLVDPNK